VLASAVLFATIDAHTRVPALRVSIPVHEVKRMRTKLLAFLLVCSATTGGAETLVLKAGRLVDGRGGGPWSPPWCD